MILVYTLPLKRYDAYVRILIQNRIQGLGYNSALSEIERTDTAILILFSLEYL